MLLTVGIDARLVGGTAGGVEHFIKGLARGLSGLSDGDEKYLFIAYRGHSEWLRPYVGGTCTIVSVELPHVRKLRLVARRLPFAARARSLLEQRRPRSVVIPTSDGLIERLGCEVMHFTTQDGFRTRIPHIYHPHDLQHAMLPSFFSPHEVIRREIVYGAFCRSASLVAVSSSWSRRNVIDHYRLPEDKVQVVPLAPAVEGAPQKFTPVNVPPRFVLYPAQMWPHKNHLRLLSALALIKRDHDVEIPVVFCGRPTEHVQLVRQRAADLGLSGSMRILGYVADEELRALYARATVLALPTEFESASFPIWEAFAAGVPVAASAVTSLPDQAGDAALLFDPCDIDAMASAIWTLWTDSGVREQLVAAGRARVAKFNWDRTARTFRAHYRRIAMRDLSPEDQQLIHADPGI